MRRQRRGFGLAALLLAAGLLTALPPTGLGMAIADGVLPGPIPVEVIEVVDGDTLAVEARIWLDQRVTTRVRLAGIDTPELRGRCPGERALAQAARDHLSALIADGPVSLTDVQYGTYAGRVVARVSAGGRDAGTALLSAGLAVDYAGRGPRTDWCAHVAERP